MHVKMISIENGVTVPEVLFTLYVNVKIVTAKIFGHFDEKALGLLQLLFQFHYRLYFWSFGMKFAYT
jgi:hypothetical protein